MVAMMPAPQPIPGPTLRLLAGYRGFLRSFDRDPIGSVSAMFDAYGPVSALTADSVRLVFALGSACNFELRMSAAQFCTGNSSLQSSAGRGATVQRLAAFTRAVEASYVASRQWARLSADPPFRDWYGNTIVESTQHMVERWGLGQQLDLVYVMRKLTLSVLLKTVLAIDADESPENMALLEDWIDNTPQRHHRLLNRVPRIAQRRAEQFIERVRVIQSKSSTQALLWPPLNSIAFGEEDAAEQRAPLSIAQRVQLINTATATLTSVLTWTIFLLSQHQRVLDDVRSELKGVLGGSLPAWPQLQTEGQRLPLLERVIKESVRLLPPCGAAVRQTAEQMMLLGYEIPAGATVVYSPYLTHRLAQVFVAPRRFRPERWLYIEPTPDDYLPLGLPGDSSLPFSLLLMHTKLVLATLLQQAQLGLSPGLHVDPSLQPVLLPTSELLMVVTPMNRAFTQREVNGTIRQMIDFGLRL